MPRRADASTRIPPPPPTVFSGRPLHVATLLTACLAFPLVWLGGLVTTKGAGMSVPDWPNSYGYNMFALPFGMWLGKTAGGTFYEHTHRLLGTAVGLAAFIATMIAWAPSASIRWRKVWLYTTLCLALTFVITLFTAWQLRYAGRIDEPTYKIWTHVFSGLGALAIASAICLGCAGPREPVRWRRWLVTAVLFVVMIQGGLGGARVDQISLTLAKIHGIFGQLVFAFAACVATACSRWWRTTSISTAPIGWLRPLAVGCLLLAIMQLSLGAFMRHDPRREADASLGDASAGLAIPDWPLHYGHVLPPTSEAGLDAVNQQRIWELHLPPVTMGRVWLHFAHRLGAYCTALVMLVTCGYGWVRFRLDRAIAWPMILLGPLVVGQISLGVLSVLWRKPADIATLHQATGALLVMTSAVLVARSLRRYPFPLRVAGGRDAQTLVESTVPQPA